MNRVPYLEKDEIPEDKQYLIESQTVREGETLRILQAIGNNLPLLKARSKYGSVLRQDSGLTVRQRELVILTVAEEVRSNYIWHQHVRFALNGILSHAEILALSERDPGVFDRGDAVLIEYVRRFVTMDVNVNVHEALSAFFDSERVVGIGMVAMGYLGLACCCEAFNVEIEDDTFAGWDLAEA